MVELDELFNRWSKLTTLQREFITAILISGVSTLLEINQQIDDWIAIDELAAEEEVILK